jgi:hypothetical protein
LCAGSHPGYNEQRNFSSRQPLLILLTLFACKSGFNHRSSSRPYSLLSRFNRCRKQSFRRRTAEAQMLVGNQ